MAEGGKGISLPKAYLVAILVEANLHGMYTILFGTAIYMLLFKRSKTRVNIAMTVLTFVMYGISTTHFGLSMHHNLIAFLEEKAGDGVLSSLDEPSHPIFYTQILLEAINCVLGDSIVVWRAWMIWGKQPWVLVVSGILMTGSSTAAVGLVYTFVHLPPAAEAATDLISDGKVDLWTTIFFGLTALVNFWVTMLIAWKAWEHRRRFKILLGHSPASMRILASVVESGLLYCLTWIILIILSVSNQNASYIVTDAISQLTGIYPTLIIVLVCINATQEDETKNLDTKASRMHTYNSNSERTETTFPGASSSYQLQTLGFSTTGGNDDVPEKDPSALLITMDSGRTHDFKTSDVLEIGRSEEGRDETRSRV